MTNRSPFLAFLRKTTYKGVHAFLIALLLFTSGLFLNAQQEITPEVRTKLEAMAPYFTTGYDRLTPSLESVGYKPDIPEIEKWPVIRRLDYAYQMSSDGGKFLALLSQQLAQAYGAVVSENPIFKPYLSAKVTSGEISWIKQESLVPSRAIPAEVKQCLVEMSVYFESGALGGATSILKNIIGISDEKAYEFLVKSKNNVDAIRLGLEYKSTSEAEMKSLVGKIASKICDNYESARNIEQIKKAVAWTDESVSYKKHIPRAQKGQTFKGHEIEAFIKRIRVDDTTVLGIEIIPDIDGSSFNVVISSTFYYKPVPTDFYRDFIRELVHVDDKNTFGKAYGIEKKMREQLNKI